MKIRDVEMKISPADDIIISPAAAGNSNPQQNRLPTGMELIRRIKVDDPRRVCHYKGYTYVGTYNNTIDRINEDGEVTESLIRLAGFPRGIIAHEDRLYVLQKGKPYSIHVFNLLGQRLFKWNHIDSVTGPCLGRALAVINNDELVVADRSNREFRIYSFIGELLRSVKCEEIRTSRISLCYSGGDSIIVTNRSVQNELFKFNLATGTVEWRSNTVKQPSAVMMLNKEYAVVTEEQRSSSVKFFILNQATGQM